MTLPVIIGLLQAVVLLAICHTFRTRASGGLKLPSGSKPYSVLGDTFDISRTRLWEAFTDWRYQYGNVAPFQVLGKSVAILNLYQPYINPLETYSTIYLDHPEAQQAQAELDKAIEQSWSLIIQDADELRCIQAIVGEALGWHSSLPLGVVRSSTQGDGHQDSFILKGPAIFSNIWLILYHPQVYPDSYSFGLSRWVIKGDCGMALNPDLPDPEVAFGFSCYFSRRTRRFSSL